MVVYDRENLIKSFQRNQSSMNSIKSAQNGQLHKTDFFSKRSKLPRLTCCSCFRPSSEPVQSTNKSLPQCTFNHGPAVEQKQNGYLVYRFTKATAHSASLPTAAAVVVGASKSKTSIFSRTRRSHSNKQLDHISEELYQYQHEYLAQVAADYQLRNEESPCCEFQTFDSSLSPLFKCRSRSFEQSMPSKIRDLNTELSHSRQLKAAAAVVAAATTTTMTDTTIPVEELRQHEVGCVILSQELSHIIPQTDSMLCHPVRSNCLSYLKAFLNTFMF